MRPARLSPSGEGERVGPGGQSERCTILVGDGGHHGFDQIGRGWGNLGSVEDPEQAFQAFASGLPFRGSGQRCLESVGLCRLQPSRCQSRSNSSNLSGVSAIALNLFLSGLAIGRGELPNAACSRLLTVPKGIFNTGRSPCTETDGNSSNQHFSQVLGHLVEHLADKLLLFLAFEPG
jgi:hypothetical protein